VSKIKGHVYKEIKPGKKRGKTFLAKTVFWFLGRGAQATAKYDSNAKAEVYSWEDGMTILLKVESNGPVMAIGKRKGKLLYLGSKEITADITIYFKNIEAALLVLTGRIGIAQAFAEHRFTLKGDIAEGMSVVRCLTTVEAYLFPKFITKKIIKRMPKKECSSFKVYTATLFGIK